MDSDTDKLAKDFVVGEADDQGRKINEIFCQTEEFVLYTTLENTELELRPYINFKTESVEEDKRRGGELTNNLNKVKPIYNQYKTFWNDNESRRLHLKKSANAFSSALNGNVVEAIRLFNSYIAEAKSVQQSEINKKLAFTLVGISWVAIFTIIALGFYLNREDIINAGHKSLLEVSFCVLFASYGAYISISIKVNLTRIDAFIDYKQFFLYAAERMLVANIAGIFVYVALKSEIIFGFASKEYYFIYVALLISMLAGFSERFAPDMLSKLNEKVRKE